MRVYTDEEKSRILSRWKLCKEEDKKFERGELPDHFGTCAWEREQIVISEMKAAGLWPPEDEVKRKQAKKERASRSLRFKALSRDNFTCRYCGRKPPEVVLEVDHVIPKSKGGKARLENLVAACFDCNRGKKDKAL